MCAAVQLSDGAECAATAEAAESPKIRAPILAWAGQVQCQGQLCPQDLDSHIFLVWEAFTHTLSSTLRLHVHG